MKTESDHNLEDWAVLILSLLFLVLALALFVSQALGDHWPTNQPESAPSIDMVFWSNAIPMVFNSDNGKTWTRTNVFTKEETELLDRYFEKLKANWIRTGKFSDDLPINQPHAPKLSISTGRVERDVCSTNITTYWPDGPQGDLEWFYLDASRQMMVRYQDENHNMVQTNVTAPVYHAQWLLMRNHANNTWSYFDGSGETNVYAPPSGIVFQTRNPQPGLSGIPNPPTPK